MDLEINGKKIEKISSSSKWKEKIFEKIKALDLPERKIALDQVAKYLSVLVQEFSDIVSTKGSIPSKKIAKDLKVKAIKTKNILDTINSIGYENLLASKDALKNRRSYEATPLNLNLQQPPGYSDLRDIVLIITNLKLEGWIIEYLGKKESRFKDEEKQSQKFDKQMKLLEERSSYKDILVADQSTIHKDFFEFLKKRNTKTVDKNSLKDLYSEYHVHLRNEFSNGNITIEKIKEFTKGYVAENFDKAITKQVVEYHIEILNKKLNAPVNTEKSTAVNPHHHDSDVGDTHPLIDHRLEF